MGSTSQATDIEHYAFHGVTVAVSADHPGVNRSLRSYLRHFPGEDTDSPDITFEFRTVSDAARHVVQRPEGNGRHVYDPMEGEALCVGDKLYLNYGDRGRVICEAERGEVRVSILESEADNEWFISHPMFIFAFMETLRRRGLYAMHAAAVCLDGKAILLPGDGGSGKSTLAIGLIREGFGFLGDDVVFLSHHGGELNVLAFPDVVDFTEDTGKMFPELHHLLSTPPGDRPKRHFRAEDVFPLEYVPSCTPRAVIFPRVSGRPKSLINPLDGDEALHRLTPNVILTDARSSQQHLDALAELVRTTRAFTLDTGTDFAEVAERLRALL